MDVLTSMQNAISELHRVMKTVKDYLEKKAPLEKAAQMNIDYSDSDQEFYLRIFMEFGQLASTIEIAMDYVDRPVRKKGQLVFDFSEGKYKLDDEYLEPGMIFEALVNGQWQIVRIQKKPGTIEYIIFDALKQTEYDVELKGLTVRVR